MDKFIQEVLRQYDFKKPQLEFIRHNENITYKLSDGEKQYEIRIHKPVEGFSLGIYHIDVNFIEYLESEMLLVDYAGKHMNSPMQKPVNNKTGEFISYLSDGTPVTVLEWVQGDTIENITVTSEIGEAIGVMVAKLHKCFNEIDFDSDNIIFSKALTHNIKRYIYNQQLLNTVKEQILKAVDKKQIMKEHAIIMEETLSVIKSRMDELDSMQGMSGIIHADLSPSNLVFSNGQIVPIDFSLSGYGFFYMDIGMVLSQYNDLNIRNCIKNGYEKTMGRQVPARYIEPFFALGILLYLACQHDRAYTQDWFSGAIERWCNTIFIPLNHNQNFVL